MRWKETYDCVKIRSNSVVGDRNTVSASIEVLVMKRLVNIADELDTHNFDKYGKQLTLQLSTLATMMGGLWIQELS